LSYIYNPFLFKGHLLRLNKLNNCPQPDILLLPELSDNELRGRGDTLNYLHQPWLKIIYNLIVLSSL